MYAWIKGVRFVLQFDNFCFKSEILEKSLVHEMNEGGGVRGSVSTMDVSFYHGRAHPTSASAIEQLQSLLKQKEGELANAQVQYIYEPFT